MHGDVCIQAGGVGNIGGNAAGGVGRVGLLFCSSKTVATPTMAMRAMMTMAMLAVHRRSNPPCGRGSAGGGRRRYRQQGGGGGWGGI